MKISLRARVWSFYDWFDADWDQVPRPATVLAVSAATATTAAKALLKLSAMFTLSRPRLSPATGSSSCCPAINGFYFLAQIRQHQRVELHSPSSTHAPRIAADGWQRSFACQ